jgi:hypothetical protein
MVRWSFQDFTTAAGNGLSHSARNLDIPYPWGAATSAQAEVTTTQLLDELLPAAHDAVAPLPSAEHLLVAAGRLSAHPY